MLHLLHTIWHWLSGLWCGLPPTPPPSPGPFKTAVRRITTNEWREAIERLERGWADRGRKAPRKRYADNRQRNQRWRKHNGLTPKGRK